MNRDELKRLVVRHVQLAFAGSEILDADKFADQIAASHAPSGVTRTEIVELVLAEAARYGGSATKIGN